jgi:hypothetical protein
MRSRLETLRRLVTLYSAVEEIHSTELQRRAAAVGEAQGALGLERENAQLARAESRGALLIEDGTGWKVAETQQETAMGRQKRLEQIYLERQRVSTAAREQYVASRLRREQMERVLGDIAAQTEAEEGRRTQAASDDRFLARSRWTDAQRKYATKNR